MVEKINSTKYLPIKGGIQLFLEQLMGVA